MSARGQEKKPCSAANPAGTKDGKKDLVGRLGLEPRTNGLKARCSTN